MRNCTHWCTKGFLSLLVLLSALSSKAQTTLATGDIAFTGYHSSNIGSVPDSFSFVLLANISSGTTISFTDRGYFSGTWQPVGSTEGSITWVSGTALPRGTEVIIGGVNSTGGGAWTYSSTTGTRTSNGTVNTSEGTYTYGLNLSSAGDQIIAFQGGNGSVTGSGVTLICGLHYGFCSTGSTSAAAWDAGCASGVSSSALPPSLTAGTSAIYLPRIGADIAAHGEFTCTGTPTTTVANIRTAVMNTSNWITTIAGNPSIVLPAACTFIGSAPVITANPANRTVCAAGSTTFTVSASGATSYQWYQNTGSGFIALTNNGVYSGVTTATLSLTGVTAAMNGYQYRAVASNASGSATSSAAGITVISPTVGSRSQTNVACNGGANGTASISSMTGGVAPYTYSWSPAGGTAATATGLSAGAYTVTITDNSGCQASQVFTITQPAAISTASWSQTNIACNGGATGAASVAPSGGAGGFTYSWSPSGGTAAMATGLVAGFYTVTVTDANSCTATRNFTITQPSAINTSISQTNVSCNGGSNGVATISASGGAGGYSYSWSPTGGTNSIATGLAAGAYTCTVTDANGCTVSRNYTITQPTAINTSSWSQTNVSCNGGSNGTATVNASGGAGGYSYSWSPSGGTAATATGLTAGVYTVTITDANSCTRTRQFTITQPTAMTSSISSTSPSCLNGNSGSATVTANGGAGSYTYNWSPAGGTAATATNLSTGSYTVTITDANGCTRVQSATVGSSTPSQQGGVAGASGSSATQTQPVGNASGSYTDGNCNRIATLTPSGSNPVSGSVATKVWVEGAVPNHTGAPYVARHYEITPANNPNTASGTVTLYFLQSEFDDFNSAPGSLRKMPTGASDATGIANLRIGKYSGTSSDNTGRPSSYTGSAIVINPADNNIVWNATEGRWEVSFDVEGFSGFFAQTSPAILPVTLRSFTATKLDGSVGLQWNTATEQNTARFDVERSADGRSYNKLGGIAAAGNSTTGKTYAYTDAQPSAVNYYRIKMIDRDGAFAYSPVAVVKMSDKGGLDIFPNPAKGVVRVQLPNSQETTLEIYNVSGRLVKSVPVARNSGNLVTIDLSGLAQGHYYLKAGTETVKFTKE